MATRQLTYGAPAKRLEKDVTQSVLNFFEDRGWRPVRMVSSVVPGAFQAGERGITDYQFIFYWENNLTFLVWVEMKNPDAKEYCRCKPGKRFLCTFCAQRHWAVEESKRSRGQAMIIRVDSIPPLEDWYNKRFAFLHGPDGVGQMRIDATLGGGT